MEARQAARGIHHDKFAYFRDSDGNEVIAHGTNNETVSASLPEFNYESLSVYKSWEPEHFNKHGEYKIREFLRLWEGKSKSSLSIEAPHPLLEKLAFLCEEQLSNPEYAQLFSELSNAIATQKNLPNLPLFLGDRRYQLFKHQKEAINAFLDNDYKGILALATGSGKTITAIHAATILARDIAKTNDVDVLILIAVPYQVLADQWVAVLKNFGFEPIAAYGAVGQWYDQLALAVNQKLFFPSARINSVVVVNKTLQSDIFQNLISNFDPVQTIFIGDECHRLGNIIKKNRIPNAEYRMGLSATPWAPHEIELKELLEGYFGKAVSYYGLAHAFADKVLVQYEYVLIEVQLTGEEGEIYEQHSKEIRKLQAIKLNGGSINEEYLNSEISKRAATLGSASEKFQKLALVLKDVEEKIGLKHLLIYCGSGSTEEDSTGVSLRDIERAQSVAASCIGLESARITAQESASLRQSILRSFESGAIHAVFAIRVLDEGFDMPGVLGAVLLASSRNERQFIQRRGRVLRTSPDKEKAIIWDFLVSGAGVMEEQFAKELAEMELARAIEFARLSRDWQKHQRSLEQHAEYNGVNFTVIYANATQSRYEVGDNE